ncbi:MAG: MarR family transcriptional regulator [Burkholderiales bacterium]|nr:MarR family transcriptional regulator [Burkholderiales bacterium]
MSRQKTPQVQTDSIARFIQDWQRERPDLDPWPLGILGRSSRIYAHFLRRADGWLSPLGLTWETFSLIAALRRSGKPWELNPTELQRQSLLTSGAMTNRIDRVEALGFVARRPDPADRRGVIVRLTSTGRTLANKAIAVHFRETAAMLATLNSRETAELDRLLAKLLADFEQAPPAPASSRPGNRKAS